MENEIIVTEVLLPEKYDAKKLMTMCCHAQERVDKKAHFFREHLSGFSCAYSTVMLVVCILHLFVKGSFMDKVYYIMTGDNFLYWLFGYLYISRVDKIMVFLCRLFRIHTDNEYLDKKFLRLLGLYVFAENLSQNLRNVADTISYTIACAGEPLVSFSGVFGALNGVNDFRWLDNEVDKFIKKAK